MRRLAHLKHKLWDGYAVLIDVFRAAFRFRLIKPVGCGVVKLCYW